MKAGGGCLVPRQQLLPCGQHARERMGTPAQASLTDSNWEESWWCETTQSFAH